MNGNDTAWTGEDAVAVCSSCPLSLRNSRGKLCPGRHAMNCLAHGHSRDSTPTQRRSRTSHHRVCVLSPLRWVLTCISPVLVSTARFLLHGTPAATSRITKRLSQNEGARFRSRMVDSLRFPPAGLVFSADVTDPTDGPRSRADSSIRVLVLAGDSIGRRC